MPLSDSPGFRDAVAVLFKPGEFAVSLFGESEEAGEVEIIPLAHVASPEKLPAFWTLSVPAWYTPEMGQVVCPKNPNEQGSRAHNQAVCLADGTTAEMDVYPTDSPFIVFEVDYLFFTKDATITPEQKNLQREAMAYAFQASGFPFAVLVDSGGKSIHATVRLDDNPSAVGQWRASQDFDRLQDLATVVFGDYDQRVMKESGRVRLVRTPGAMRDVNTKQTILAVGKRTSIAQLMQWFVDQLSPEAQRSLFARQPVTTKESPLREHYLRLHKWRTDLLRDHNPGERGLNWYHVSKALMVAGCREPRMVARPSPQAPQGQWEAAWLWHVSAYTFNHLSNGWFFSQNPQDWGNPAERVRWDAETTRRQYVNEQRAFERATDPVQNILADQMMTHQAMAEANAIVATLPMPPMAGPPMHIGGTVGATLVESKDAKTPGEKPEKIKKHEGEHPFVWVMPHLRKTLKQEHLIKLSDKYSGKWYWFDGKIWQDWTKDFAKAIISRILGINDLDEKYVNDAFMTVSRTIVVNHPWVEYPNAIAFQNGTLYVDPDGVEFVPGFSPEDKLRSIVPCNYDPSAVCPRWQAFVNWALPEPSRASLLQEAFGYTLIPGQLFQSFFMMTGTGSNGKSVVLSVLQSLHKDSFETVALSKLGGRFALGTIGRKRLAIDTEAENVNNNVQIDGNSSTAILKSWTGGDPVQMEIKGVQGWTEVVSAKYFMSCNKRPRFADPTKGVWRRLKLLKFESHIEERQADSALPAKLVQELPGIVNWALQGLQRLFQQNGFTKSEVLSSDLSEYQIDSDSVAMFVQEFMRPALGSEQMWFDIRPIHAAYKQRCADSMNQAVSETEFRNRLGMLNITVGRPTEHETVNGCPLGTEKMSGLQHWAIKGWRCCHESYNKQSLMGSYAPPMSMPVRVA